VTDRRNPYVGLRPFLRRDSLYFFGREEQTSELLQILHHQRFLGIVGSSGSGKSSIVRAGLLPALLGGFLVEDRNRWRVVQVKPGDAPIANLAAGIVDAVEDHSDPRAARDLEESIRDGLEAAVLEYLAGRANSRDENIFILVDQFEEIFAFRRMTGADGRDATDPDVVATSVFPVAATGAEHGDEQVRARERARRRGEAADYVALLMALAEQRDQQIYVALTMRTDFLGDCDLFYGLPEALNRGQYLVPRLTRQQLRRAIEDPAKLMGARFAPRLMDHLLNELGDRSDRLPVLQHALLRTWDRWQERGASGPIDLEHFEAAGGLENALNLDAEEALRGLDVGITEHVFRRLTDTDLSQRRVRNPARVSELVSASGADRSAVSAVLGRFEGDGRSFIYASADGVPDDPRVDISHESLIRQWRRLREWVDEERDSRDRFKELVERARKWQRGETGLMQEPELRLHTSWQREQSPSAAWARRYSESEDDFQVATEYLGKSVRGDKQRLLRLAGVITMLVVVSGLAAFGFRERTRAMGALATAVSQTIASEAGAVIGGEQSGGIELSLQQLVAAHALDSLAPAVASEVFDAVVALRRVQRVVDLDSVTVAAISQDGSRIATGGNSGTVRLYDSTFQLIREIVGAHPGEVGHLLFDPASRRLLSLGGDSLAHVWNAVTGDAIASFAIDGTFVDAGFDGERLRYAAYPTDGDDLVVGHTPDRAGARLPGDAGQQVSGGSLGSAHALFVTGGFDSFVRVFDLRATGPVERHRFRTGRPVDVALSRGDSLVATIDIGSPVIRLWSLDGKLRWGTSLPDSAPPDDPSYLRDVTSVAFSENDSLLVAGYDDGSAQVFDVRTGRPATPMLEGHVGWVTRVAVNRDGTRVTVVGFEGAAVLDGSAAPSIGDPIFASKPVSSLAFNPVDSEIAAGTLGGTVERFDVSTRQPAGTMREPEPSDVRGLAFSPDGSLLATGSAESGVRLLNVATGATVQVLPGSALFSGGLAFDPEGIRVFAGLASGGVRVWTAATGDTIATVRHQRAVSALAFSADGSTFATGDVAGAIRIWRATTGELIQPIADAHKGGVTSVAFSPTELKIASGGNDGIVRLWTAPEMLGPWSLQAVASGHADAVNAVSFSQDGRVFATGSTDNMVRRWDAGTGMPLGEPYTGHLFPVTSVIIAGNDQIISGSSDGTIRTWPVRDVGIQAICQKLTRNLRVSDWPVVVSQDLKPRRSLCPGLPDPD
jgi:WD40 repeat protein